MKQHDFELLVLKLWTTSRVPMTRANLIAFTKAERGKVDEWTDAMIKDGIVELDSDDAGEKLFLVRGAERPASGSTAVHQLEKLKSIESSLDSPKKTKATDGIVARLKADTELVKEENKKSVLVSGGLSLFFGPLGWLYSAPFKEAIPGAIAYLLLIKIVPTFLLMYLLPVVGPLSAIAGLLYAWSYNRVGHRASLFLKDEKEESKLLGRGK